MFDLKNMAVNLLTKNPAIANNPQAQNYLGVIQNGDSARGQWYDSAHGIQPQPQSHGSVQ